MMKHVARVVSVEGPVHESEIVIRIRSTDDPPAEAPYKSSGGKADINQTRSREISELMGQIRN